MLTSSEPIASDASGRTRGRSVYQRPLEVHRDVPALAWRRGAGFKLETFANPFQELGRRETSQVLHRPVVRQDLHLVVRERDGQERRAVGTVPKRCAGGARRVPFPPASARRSRRDGDRQQCRGPARRGRPHEPIALRAVHAPQRMAHTHRAPKSRTGRSRPTTPAAIRSISGARAVGQKYRPRLGAERQHVARAIVFLVAPGPLVFPDDVVVVLVEREAPGQADLLVSAHAQPVQVEARHVLEDQR